MILLAADVVDNGSIRVADKTSIRDFVAEHREVLAHGRVLDFGCGLQPYRDLVDGEYVGYDRVAFPGNVSKNNIGPDLDDLGGYDAILCTQMLQYVPAPADTIKLFAALLRTGGALVCTYATAWAVIEPGDKWRLTDHGMNVLLHNAGFTVLTHACRLAIDCRGFVVPIGYGVVAQR